jgi:hypothetical protein
MSFEMNVGEEKIMMYSIPSLTIRTCLPRKRNLASERALVSFLDELTVLTVKADKTFLCELDSLFVNLKMGDVQQI